MKPSLVSSACSIDPIWVRIIKDCVSFCGAKTLCHVYAARPFPVFWRTGYAVAFLLSGQYLPGPNYSLHCEPEKLEGSIESCPLFLLHRSRSPHLLSSARFFTPFVSWLLVLVCASFHCRLGGYHPSFLISLFFCLSLFPV